MYNVLKSDILRELSGETQAKIDSYAKWFLVLASIIGVLIAFIGIKSFSDLKKSIGDDIISYILNSDRFRDMVGSEVRKKVNEETSQMASRVDSLDDGLKFFRLKLSTDDIDAKDTFSQIERDALMDDLRGIKDAKSVTRSAAFAVTLEKAISQFFQAGNFDNLPELEDMFADVIKEHRGIVYILIQVYGMVILGGTEYPPDFLVRFKHYANICRVINYYEIPLPYLMVLEHRDKNPGWENRLESLIEDAACLFPNEQKTVLQALDTYSDVNKFMRRASGRGKRMAHAFKSFQDEYSTTLNRIFEKQAQPAGQAAPGDQPETDVSAAA